MALANIKILSFDERFSTMKLKVEEYYEVI